MTWNTTTNPQELCLWMNRRRTKLAENKHIHSTFDIPDRFAYFQLVGEPDDSFPDSEADLCFFAPRWGEDLQLQTSAASQPHNLIHLFISASRFMLSICRLLSVWESRFTSGLRWKEVVSSTPTIMSVQTFMMASAARRSTATASRHTWRN